MNADDVARCARVSPSTVSRVLNNAASVRSATRARVVKAMEALRYGPNLHARSLATGKSRSIGIIVSNIENPFFLDIYRAVERGIRGAGYELILASTDYSSESLVSNVRLMLGSQVAGLAAIVSEMDAALIEELSGSRVPVVFYDLGAPRRNIFNIRVNCRRGMETLISCLYSLGHRRVGFVGHRATLGPVSERSRAALDAVRHDSDFQVATVAGADSLEGGRCAARALLGANPDVTAIVCVNDWMAVGALRELREGGLRVPGDISVTGFDDISMAQFSFPPLTSVHIPRDRIGQIICDRLMNLRAVQFQREFVIDPELVIRDSTGPAATRGGAILKSSRRV